MATASFDADVKLWDLRTGDPSGQVCDRHFTQSLQRTFSPDPLAIVRGLSEGSALANAVWARMLEHLCSEGLCCPLKRARLPCTLGPFCHWHFRSAQAMCAWGRVDTVTATIKVKDEDILRGSGG